MTSMLANHLTAWLFVGASVMGMPMQTGCTGTLGILPGIPGADCMRQRSRRRAA